MAFFKKCSACGHWVCPENCWNEKHGLCDACAPESTQAGAKEANKLETDQAVKDADAGKGQAAAACPSCGARVHSGKFCEACGANLQAKKSCPSCKAALEPTAKFCGECGAKA
jgi:hypothetical protein